MSLARWVEHRWLLPHEAAASDVAALLAAASDDLKDARQDISPAWRFAIAYNAALRLCTAVLAAAGLRAARDQKHYRTIAALPFLLGDEATDLAEFLDTCRLKRHDVTYEALSAVSTAEADELIEAVVELEGRVRGWLGTR